VIFSYDERKAGSYFGADLYEKCIAVDETAEASSLDLSVNISQMQKLWLMLFSLRKQMLMERNSFQTDLSLLQ